MSHDVISAESSPAQEVSAVRSLESLNPTERDQWRMTGAFPESSDGAESTPAEPAAQAASTDANESPASEPGKPAKRNAETRIQELLREKKQLAERVKALEASSPAQAVSVPDAPAASSPAPIAEDFPGYDQWLEAPENDGKSYETYTRALVRHTLALEQQQVARQQAITAKVGGFKARIEAVTASDPQFWATMSPEVIALRPLDVLDPSETPTALNYVAQEIIESPQAPLLMRHFSEHPEALAALASQSQTAVVRAIGRLEGQLITPSAPPVPFVTKAPAPVTTLGKKADTPPDDVQAAISRGDFQAYRDAENRRRAHA